MMKDTVSEKLKGRRDKLLRRNRRYVSWSRNWAKFVVAGLFIYVALPFIAPTMMAVGATGAGNALYTIYSPMCHQFAFRSFFLYGDQLTYPREVVEGKSDQKSFDEQAAQSETFVELFEKARRNELRREGHVAEGIAYEFQGPEDLQTWTAALQISARQFRGDEKMGYKVAICERDISIYGAMTVGGIGFLFVRKRLRPVPLALYALLGLGPIGLDGFSQLLSYAPFEFWPVRETLPEFRVLTGALFGLMNVWLAFPYLERSFQKSADEMEATIHTIEDQEL